MKAMADFWLIAPGQTSDRILTEAAERMIFPDNY